AMRDAALGLDRARLDEDGGGTALREFSEVHKVPVGDKAVLRRILAHGRDHDAVLQRNFAKRDRRKQHGLSHRSSLVHWARVTTEKSFRRWAAIASRMPLINS